MAFLRAILVLLLFETSVVASFGQEAAAPDISLLFRALVHPDASIRQAAAVRLNEAGADAAGPLVEMLQSGDLAEAVTAATVLAGTDEAGRGRLRPALVALLSSSQIEDWRWSVAASVLGSIDPERTGLLDLFVGRLESDSPLVQYAALQAVTAIAPAVRDIQPDRVAEAREALLDLLRRYRRPLTEILLQPSGAQFGQVAFRAETPWLDDFVILNALHAANCNDSQLMNLLNQRAQPGRSEHVQLAAAKQLLTLGADGKRSAAEVLARLMRNHYNRVGTAALDLATQLGPDGERIVPHLADVLLGPDAEQRKNAAIALGNMGPSAKGALPQLKMGLALELTRGVSGKQVAKVMEDAITKITAAPAPKKP